MPGKIATIAITAFWLAMMGWLVKSEVVPFISAYRKAARAEGYSRLEALAERQPHSQAGIYFGGQRIGYYVQELRKQDDDLTLNGYCFLQLSKAGGSMLSGLGTMDTAIRSSAHFRQKRLQEFNMFVSTPPDAPPEVHVNGTAIADALVLKIKDPSGTRNETLPLAVGETLSVDMAPMAGAGKLKLGQKWGVPTFSLQSRRSVMAMAEVVAEEKIEIGGRAYDAYRVEVKYGEGVVSLTVVVWLGRDGEALKQQVGPFTLLREDPTEEVLQKLRRRHD